MECNFGTVLTDDIPQSDIISKRRWKLAIQVAYKLASEWRGTRMTDYEVQDYDCRHKSERIGQGHARPLPFGGVSSLFRTFTILIMFGYSPVYDYTVLKDSSLKEI
ncbi:hypothetical protein OUZ56_019827 [Daphnia magna]|uniref:Uncharacterized protein n=1 Tax=Daphnia magna TaxID=35525 RepID=A0ABQ9ZCR3_9CRUS|nr:hypothetical protein OUZ56_019827 [Daphnia magna]